MWLALQQHIKLTAISTFFVLIIAIPLGIALTRSKLRRATPLAMAFANIGQATPGHRPAGPAGDLAGHRRRGRRSIGMVIYAVLPVLANTIAGLRAIDPTLIEAARGIGMSPMGVLTRVELPLAVPLILAGVRTALVLNVGTATLATFGGGGGLGDLISAGITTQRMPVLILGSVLTVALALLVDWLASLAELLLRPRGLEVDGMSGHRPGPGTAARRGRAATAARSPPSPSADAAWPAAARWPTTCGPGPRRAGAARWRAPSSP